MNNTISDNDNDNTKNDNDNTNNDNNILSYTFPTLAKLLCSLGLEEYYTEITEKVLYPLYDKCLSYDSYDQCIDIVSSWSVHKLCSFIKSCSFLNYEIVSSFYKEFIDGIDNINNFLIIKI